MGYRKTIIWLDGRPEALRLVRGLRSILDLQGIKIVIPASLDGVEDARGDVVVAPPRGPEEAIARTIALRTRAGLISDVKPRRALFKALAYPRKDFDSVAVGVDPGRSCAAAVVADGLLIWYWSGECVDLPVMIESLIEDLGYSAVRVYVGLGTGSVEVIEMLGSNGVTVYGVPEEGSTSSPFQPPLRLVEAIDDEHVLAALTIAYKGLVSWPRPA